MEFDPRNNVIRLCVKGMAMDEAGDRAAAAGLFRQAWDEAANDFERFTAAYFVARHQASIAERLNWLETALRFAHKVNDESVTAAFPWLYSEIAECCEGLDDIDGARKNRDLANSFTNDPTDNGPFYHGTRADLKVGDLLTPGGNSNYQSGLVMNHIYFTALVNGAGLAAALANGDGAERVYLVEPTGPFEHDPNVTNKKFPGNPTRSYRSMSPLTIIGEVDDWARQTPEQVRQWREKLAGSKGEIIN